MKLEDIIIYLKQNYKIILLALLSSILLVSGYIYWNKTTVEEENVSYSTVVTNTESEEKIEKNESNDVVIVDIKGEINNPGVYELTKEKRIKDAIDAAGGLKENADTSKINLSQKLKDQMMIVIPKIGEQLKQNSAEQYNENNKKIVNINTASKEELMTINGIGETKAKAIISYRENKGEFTKIEDITKVNGIGKSTFEKIKENIEV